MKQKTQIMLCCAVLSHLVMSVTLWALAHQPLLFMGFLQVRMLEWVTIPSSRDLPNPGIEPRSPTLQADSLPSQPPGKPKSTGLGSLTHLQGIFPTQESNRGLLHCRRILYQLNYQESPQITLYICKTFPQEKL